MGKEQHNVSHLMKFITPSLLLVVATLSLVACKEQTVEEQQALIKETVTEQLAAQSVFQCIPAKLTIGEKQVDSVVQWNTKTGEARLLNAASFADKSTGQQGNLIGWVPLVDLNQAVQNLAAQIQSRQTNKAATPASTPASTPIKAKASQDKD